VEQLWRLYVRDAGNRNDRLSSVFFFNIADILITFLFAIIGFKIGHIEPTTVIKEPPDEATLYGIGGQRLDPTEHELAVTG
jgi:hypothetical protein